MLRRALALGGGLMVLILIVLGVKGCLDARAHRALSDYARNVTQIVEETEADQQGASSASSKNPAASRSPSSSPRSTPTAARWTATPPRIDGLERPRRHGPRAERLELVYELRGSAMDEIADKMSTALGDVGAEKATAAIAKQMQKLLATDVVYAQVVAAGNRRRPRRQRDRRRRRAEERLPPRRDQWLEESTVSSALGAVSGVERRSDAGRARPRPDSAPASTAPNWSPKRPASVAGEETPEVEVEVQNQGESTENGVTVSVTVERRRPLQGRHRQHRRRRNRDR